MRRAAKVDANQKQIVAALRQLGASVAITSTTGQGFPDICCGFRGRNVLFEIKDGSKPPSARKLTPDQIDFHAAWKGEIAVITSATEAVDYLLRG